MTLDISVVVPVYGCDDAVVILYQRLVKILETMAISFELIFVDDRGPGDPWGVICELVKEDDRVHGIRLSRNFGQHYAISAGIDHSRGKRLVVMDCDLQDRPEEIIKFWEKADEGYDVVVGRRIVRKDGLLKKLSSKLFHRVWSYMTDQPSDCAQSNFGIYSQKVIRELKSMPESGRVFPLLVRWIGFESTSIDIDHDYRFSGKGSYTLAKLLALAFDAIISHSNKPLKMFIKVGFFMALASFCSGIWIIVRYFFFYQGQTLLGWSSIMVSLYFLSGIMLLGMGVLGVYIGRIFNQVKGRPLYIVSEMAINCSNNQEKVGG